MTEQKDFTYQADHSVLLLELVDVLYPGGVLRLALQTPQRQSKHLSKRSVWQYLCRDVEQADAKFSRLVKREAARPAATRMLKPGSRSNNGPH